MRKVCGCLLVCHLDLEFWSAHRRMAVRALCPEAGEEVWDAEGRWGHMVEVWVTQEVHRFEL
jgi:hypothetical protein